MQILHSQTFPECDFLTRGLFQVRLLHSRFLRWQIMTIGWRIVTLWLAYFPFLRFLRVQIFALTSFPECRFCTCKSPPNSDFSPVSYPPGAGFVGVQLPVDLNNLT